MMIDPETNEITVNCHDIVYRERCSVMEHIEGLAIAPIALDTATTVPTNINDKDQAPLFDARLPGLCIAAARFPVSIHGDMISIHRHFIRYIALDDYVHSGAFAMLSASQSHFIGQQGRTVPDHTAEGGEALMRCL